MMFVSRAGVKPNIYIYINIFPYSFGLLYCKENIYSQPVEAHSSERKLVFQLNVKYQFRDDNKGVLY